MTNNENLNAAQRSRISNRGNAEIGRRAIAWAGMHCPVMNGLLRDTLKDGSLKGRKIALVIHLEAKTAYLATILAEAGAHVVVAGSNPHSTKDDITAALVEKGIEVHATENSSYEQWEEDLLAVADTEPEYVIDDGVELTMRMAKYRPELYAKLKGVSEETTTGVARLRTLEKAGRLPFSAMAANDAACKHMFDNRYGTGQSTVQAVLALTNFLMAGKNVAIVGYGWVGRGIANYVKQLGGLATIIEIDPIKALEAFSDGHKVANAENALRNADIVITATGGMRAIASRHFPFLKDNVVLANAGHHDLEIDVVALKEESTEVNEIRHQVYCYNYKGSKRVNVLAGGALVNIAGGLGHAIEIMDLSFSVQGLSCHELVTGNYEPGVHVIPKALDESIARARLAHEGIVLDSMSDDQYDSAAKWVEE